MKYITTRGGRRILRAARLNRQAREEEIGREIRPTLAPAPHRPQVHECTPKLENAGTGAALLRCSDCGRRWRVSYENRAGLERLIETIKKIRSGKRKSFA